MRNINYIFLTYKASTGTDPAGNLSVGGTYTIYADDAAVNNIGTITIDAGGITEVDDSTTGAKYTLLLVLSPS